MNDWINCKVKEKYSRLTVLNEVAKKNNHRSLLCRCDCGKEIIVRLLDLETEKTKSCGCYKNDMIKTRCTTHGQSKTRLYKIWKGMKKRCYNPKCERYPHYGGRGIIICDEWLNDFEPFWNWAMVNGYSDELSIERKESNGNYEPENCRWITMKEQASNKTTNKLITFNGVTQNLKQWSTSLNMSYRALIYRFLNGWSVEEAFTTPIMVRK